MLQRSKTLHVMYDDKVKAEIVRLFEILEGTENKRKLDEIEQKKEQFEEFFTQPGNLEIRTSSITEIFNRLKARNIKSPSEMNQLPYGVLFRMALNE